MDRAKNREQMEAIRSELTHLEEQKEALAVMLQSYERWFRVNPENGRRPRQLPLGRGGRGVAPKGSISFQRGLVQVMREARGEPLRADEVWQRMQQVGVVSEAKNPQGFISLTVRRIDEIQQVGPRTWQWTGPLNGEER